VVTWTLGFASLPVLVAVPSLSSHLAPAPHSGKLCRARRVLPSVPLLSCVMSQVNGDVSAQRNAPPPAPAGGDLAIVSGFDTLCAVLSSDVPAVTRLAA
jgi:hypothetical protein